MELNVNINLTVIFALNILFLVSGVCLNSLVILSFWRNDQLRKKLCYFMIMVLSCFDLLALFTNHSFTAFLTLHWLITGKLLVWEWLYITFLSANILLGLPFVALLVMNFDRYLVTYYPLFHRTSVTRGKLLIPLVVLVLQSCRSHLNTIKLVIHYEVFLAISCVIFLLPIIFFNYKLFIIARKSRRNKTKTRGEKNVFFKTDFMLFALHGLFYIINNSYICLHLADHYICWR